MKLPQLRSLRIILPLVGAGMLWLLFACAPPSPAVTDLGGSEVVGRLIVPGDLPVVDAEVKVLRIISRDPRANSYDTTVEASVYSAADGTFKLENLPAEELTLVVYYKDDSLRLNPLRFTPDPEKRFDLGVLVMKAPGAILGWVQLERGGPDVDITCYIAGTSMSAVTNESTSSFIISPVFPVDTAYSITISAVGYSRIVVPDVFVKAGDSVVIRDTIRLTLDPSGSPTVTPAWKTVEYDTASGIARLYWEPVPLEDVHRYIVFTNNGTVTNRDTVNDTMAKITVFSNPSDTVARFVTFQVAAIDDDYNKGPRGEIDTLLAIPPSWLRVNLSLSKIEETSSIDSATIAISYNGKLRKIMSVTWWIDHPDSIIRNINLEGDLAGADTLTFQVAAGRKQVYVTLTDNTGKKWTDSLDASSLLPSDKWVTFDSLEYARRYACAEVVDSKIYVFGGCSDRLSAAGTAQPRPVTAVEMYDPQTKKWNTLSTKMNYPRFKAASATVNGKIYVFGGSGNQVDITAVEEYDPATDIWRVIDSMHLTMVGASACVIDNLIYLTGGVSFNGDMERVLDTILTYDPQTGIIETNGVLSYPRELHRTVVLDRRLVVLGGLAYNHEDDSYFPAETIEFFGSNEMSTGILPLDCESRFGLGAAVAKGSVFLFGGMRVAFNDGTTMVYPPIETVVSFSIDNGVEWHRVADMPVGLEGVATAELDGRIYVISGSSASLNSTRTVYVYYP